MVYSVLNLLCFLRILKNNKKVRTKKEILKDQVTTQEINKNLDFQANALRRELVQISSLETSKFIVYCLGREWIL